MEVWPYLLRLDSPSASREQHAKLRSQLTRSYAALLQRCQVTPQNPLAQSSTIAFAPFALPACEEAHA